MVMKSVLVIFDKLWIVQLLLSAIVALVIVLVLSITLEISHIEDVIYVREEIFLQVLCLLSVFVMYVLIIVLTMRWNGNISDQLSDFAVLRNVLSAILPCISLLLAKIIPTNTPAATTTAPPLSSSSSPPLPTTVATKVIQKPSSKPSFFHRKNPYQELQESTPTLGATPVHTVTIIKSTPDHLDNEMEPVRLSLPPSSSNPLVSTSATTTYNNSADPSTISNHPNATNATNANASTNPSTNASYVAMSDTIASANLMLNSSSNANAKANANTNTIANVNENTQLNDDEKNEAMNESNLTFKERFRFTFRPRTTNAQSYTIIRIIQDYMGKKKTNCQQQTVSTQQKIYRLQWSLNFFIFLFFKKKKKYIYNK
ncbi:hypothetical protein RFI_21465 [Reticulomyxa filosa]|uniref:Uncharacterized protein n=1 Tax=Reticulomyxa filosa TaxID=46433 RepID=X6MR61_RETFI|nr:hypothetical protein RFI_21465 [Reticulomyxa filosa]|eukprot:ETO15902.1 hypothetical protein RFI_21465 [Reticulomyxa filosa]